MTPENRNVKDIKGQLERQEFSPNPLTVRCPWCNRDNAENEPFCCDKLRRAVLVILADTQNQKVNHA